MARSRLASVRRPVAAHRGWSGIWIMELARRRPWLACTVALAATSCLAADAWSQSATPASRSAADQMAAGPDDLPEPAMQSRSDRAPGSDSADDGDSSGGAQRQAHFVPRISISETRTDNPRLAADSAKRSDWVTDVAPGFRLQDRGARAQVFLDYQLDRLSYRNDSVGKDTRHLLNAYGGIEAVERLLYFGARAVVQQQSISAFSGQAASVTNDSANSSETAVYQVSPLLRTRLGGSGDFQLRYVAALASARDSAALPTTRTRELLGSAQSTSWFAGFGWAIDGSDRKIRNIVDGESFDRRIQGSLIYQVTPQFKITAIDGHETSNLANPPHEQGNSTHGAGLEWAPNERTRLAEVTQKRFFGIGHRFTLSYRTALTAWSYSDTRDSVETMTQLAAVNAGTAFGVMNALLIPSVSDAEARASAANALLAESGISPDAHLVGGFLAARPHVEERKEGSVAVMSGRDTFVLSIARSDDERIGPQGTATDSFSLSREIRQQGFEANWVHRLTPATTMTLIDSWQRSEGLTVSGLNAKQRTWNLVFRTQVGHRTYVSFGARNVRFDGSAVQSYNERAAYAGLAIFF